MAIGRALMRIRTLFRHSLAPSTVPSLVIFSVISISTSPCNHNSYPSDDTANTCCIHKDNNTNACMIMDGSCFRVPYW